ncbi:MAG: M56 family metallopeptidase [Niastella sp.]|nr:M56 family metallopeptidase [Niastella sp.]
MNLVNQSAFLKALGWSLLDSLWQMGALWLIYVLLTANGRRFNARQRHTLALLSLAGGSGWFLTTLIINFYKAAAAPEMITLVVNAGENLPAVKSGMSTFLEPVLPFLSVAYLLITAGLFFRFYHQYRSTRRLFHQGLQKANPELRVFLQQAVQHMSIHRKVNIWLSSLVDTPLTIGFWKPIILLPIAAVNNLSIEQTEAIILHELNHIRRNDYLVNLLIACTDIILFFNPFAQLFSGVIRREREHSCDDMVLQFRYDASQYARALLTLEQNRAIGSPALAVAATGNNTLLLNRVKRMLTKEPVTIALNQKLVAWLLSAFLIGFIGWYNPGRAIVTTIKETAVTAPENPVVEFAANISTPALPAPAASPKAAPKAQAVADDFAAVQVHDGQEEQTDLDPLADLDEMDADDHSNLRHELVQFASQQRPIVQNMVSFVQTKEMRDYSMQAAKEALASVGSINTHPFVPGNSFIVQILEDTLLPKKYTMTQAEKEARESLDKALMALKQIDWQKLEKGLKATGESTVDIEQLQNEIRKALKEVDWKKVNKETEAAIAEARREMAEEQAALRVQMERYNQARQEKQEKQQQVQYQILMDRLGENQKATTCETEKKATQAKTAKKKKIVVI